MLSRIKEIIEAKNLTPSRFADHVDVPRSTISHILSGRNKPSLEVVQKILEAFPDIPAEWLVRGKGLYENSQRDLFSEFGKTEEEAKPLNKEVHKEEISRQVPEKDITSTTSNNDDAAEFISAKENNENVSSLKNNNSGNHSEKVIVLYADGTYAEYIPR